MRSKNLENKYRTIETPQPERELNNHIHQEIIKTVERNYEKLKEEIKGLYRFGCI